MSVDEANKVDFVVIDKSQGGSIAVLAITDHLGWDEASKGEHLLVLQNKLYRYLDFMESGELVEKYPRAMGLPVVIRVIGKYPRSAEALRFYELMTDYLKKEGYRLEFEQFEPHQTKARHNEG